MLLKYRDCYRPSPRVALLGKFTVAVLAAGLVTLTLRLIGRLLVLAAAQRPACVFKLVTRACCCSGLVVLPSRGAAFRAAAQPWGDPGGVRFKLLAHGTCTSWPVASQARGRTLRQSPV